LVKTWNTAPKPYLRLKKFKQNNAANYLTIQHLIQKYIVLIVCLLVLKSTNAQNIDTNSTTIIAPSINEIIGLKPTVTNETKVTIANLQETNIYEAPSIITIISEAEIKALGYRDLLDVLITIPGISIATDIQNGTSISIRGLWAEEGKVLFMVNGLVMNDMAYGSIILGQRFPLGNIKRIEIIRGAGSSIYGGVAALGVINLVTKTGQEANGHHVHVSGGVSNKAFSRAGINYNYGGIMLKGIELTANAYINAGNISNETITLLDSTRANFKDSSDINSILASFTAKYKQFYFKHVYEDYNFQATYEPTYSLTRTAVSYLSYTLQYKKINIIPFIDSKWQMPWNNQYGNPNVYNKQNLITRRNIIGFNSNYKPKTWLSILVGGKYYLDSYRYVRNALPLNNGMLKQSYVGIIAYIDALITTKFVNVSIGRRLDNYAYFKPNVVPRFALTKSFKHIHYKAVYGQSFKIPPLQNINLDVTKTLVPELVDDTQLEFGYHSKTVFVTATYFNTVLQNNIIFGYDKQLNESYVNSGNINTHGFEIETKLKLKALTVKANYSTFGVISSTTNEITVDTSNLSLGTLALPKNKFVAIINYDFNTKNTLSVNYILQTRKYSYERESVTTGNYVATEFPATHNINVIYQRNGMFDNFIDVSVGLYNVLNTHNTNLYTYKQGHFPVPGMGRELFVNVKVNF
jgi:outer membrane cobalamin receptor